MNPDQFTQLGIRLYGRKAWKAELAIALGVNRTTIHRLTKREQIPGPVEVALKGLVEHKRRQDELDKAAVKLARKLKVPYKLKKRRPRKPYTRQPKPIEGDINEPETSS
jgi:DNA-binding transcriptional regulator LsrR (DeoR family)